MSDMGLSLFARGIQFHPPLALSVLVLDGNMLSDAGILYIIAMCEGPNRPRALKASFSGGCCGSSCCMSEAPRCLSRAVGRFPVWKVVWCVVASRCRVAILLVS